MYKIKLVTDSTSDLSQELIKKHDIAVVPLYVNFKEQSFRDNEDITTEKMYEMITKLGYLPKTSATSPGAFEEVFQKYLAEGYEIIYTGIGNNFSATLKSAYAAKQTLNSDKIYLIDSANLSSGSGLLLLKAAKFRSEGMKASDIAAKLEELVPKVRSQFVIDTLEYLYKGGRLNALSTFMGTMLKIKPIIKVRDGIMVVGKKGRGNIRNGIKLLLQEVIELKDQIDPDFMMITHSLADESARFIESELDGKISVENMYETNAGCVISSHCGRGTIGILYVLK
ncbi:MAG: DegV family protein [Bacilli bacterium]|nr:DegV family protein [Bacilli bacterium]MBN2696919.1 DegV family protein [Bacilli bacterium]